MTCPVVLPLFLAAAAMAQGAPVPQAELRVERSYDLSSLTRDLTS